MLEDFVLVDTRECLLLFTAERNIGLNYIVYQSPLPNHSFGGLIFSNCFCVNDLQSWAANDLDY